MGLASPGPSRSRMVAFRRYPYHGWITPSQRIEARPDTGKPCPCARGTDDGRRSVASRGGVLAGSPGLVATETVVTAPLLVIGLGLGALASQLGAVTVSAAPEELSPEVGGLQNTASQFGASLGTALAGSVLITALTASFLSLIAANPDVPADVSDQATVELASGIPFISDQDLETALEGSSLDAQTTDEILEDYGQARLEGIRTALSLLAVFAVIALYFTRRIPDRPPGSAPTGAG